MGLNRLEDQVGKERRDLRVFETVLDRGPIGIRSLADVTGLPEHKVRYSLRMLENDGLVEPSPDGSRPVDGIEARIDDLHRGIDRLSDRLEALPEIFDDVEVD